MILYIFAAQEWVFDPRLGIMYLNLFDAFQLIDLVVGAVGWVAHRCVRYDPIIDLSTHAPLVRGSIIPATCSSQEFRLDRVGPFFVFKVPVCGARFQCPLTGSLSHAA